MEINLDSLSLTYVAVAGGDMDVLLPSVWDKQKDSVVFTG